MQSMKHRPPCSKHGVEKRLDPSSLLPIGDLKRGVIFWCIQRLSSDDATSKENTTMANSNSSSSLTYPSATQNLSFEAAEHVPG